MWVDAFLTLKAFLPGWGFAFLPRVLSMSWFVCLEAFSTRGCLEALRGICVCVEPFLARVLPPGWSCMCVEAFSTLDAFLALKAFLPD